MKYFLILGSNPSLSLAEILAISGNDDNFQKVQAHDRRFVFIETKKEINCAELVKKMGGAIKIGIISMEKNNLGIADFIQTAGTANIDFKYKFGFSVYSQVRMNINRFAMEFKKYLKEDGVSSRWVTSKENDLSSVIVEQNKLVEKGVDFCVFKIGNIFYLGKTLAVQDFKGLSRRDYGRPERDDESGMIPPKLAQIMLNIAQVKEKTVFLDPFCGSGTILAEASVMGVKKIYGTDISQKAIDDSRKNLNWLQRDERYNANFQLHKISATKVSEIIEEEIDAVVTEPYLGPQRGEHDLHKTVSELENLYSDSLKSIYQCLKKGADVVMVWPVFVSRAGDKKKLFLDKINHSGFEIVPLINQEYLKNNMFSLSQKGGIVYGRPGQKVWREIIHLKKK
ncbi:hypothetical protein C0584_00855 [Candidatus Parcubacteria bacterium]|nr:MAG: hypothetical protein C0584_00855 [Candidatus Parcubacteria bacterium]